MKKLFAAIAVLVLPLTLLAQTPAPEIDTLRNPVQQGDPEPRTLPSNNYLEGYVRIMPDELPASVIETLESERAYAGWRRAAVYTNADQTSFIVELSAGGNLKTWKFNERGKPIPLNNQ